MRLFDRRLILVSGKGGVGKSTISAALALSAAKAGLKVLLCELDSGRRQSRLFSERSAGSEDAFKKNISILYVDPEAAMEEYLKIYLRIRQVYKPIVQSPAVNYFLQAAPGFRELLIIGKIWWEVQLEEGRPKRHKWDVVIVDAPATGHGISFMGVAHAVSSMVRIGPIHTQAEKMVNTLQDKRITALVTVCIPEEMPVNETVEFIDRADKSLGIPIGPIIMNTMPSTVFEDRDIVRWRELRDRVESDPNASPELKGLVSLSKMGRKRRESALDYRQHLQDRIPSAEIVDVPNIYLWNWNIDTVKEISGYLKNGLDL